MNRIWMFAISFAWLVNPAVANAQPEKSISRGELLYATHCIACHDTEIHWRDKKLATDWNSLKAQVRRWQGVAGLGWRNDDITLVARHLNALHYHYPELVQKSGPAPRESKPAPRAPPSSPTLPAIPDLPLR